MYMLIVRLKNDEEKDVLYVRFLSNEEIGIELEKFKKLMEESNNYKNDRKVIGKYEENIKKNNIYTWINGGGNWYWK